MARRASGQSLADRPERDCSRMSPGPVRRQRYACVPLRDLMTRELGIAGRKSPDAGHLPRSSVAEGRRVGG